MVRTKIHKKGEEETPEYRRLQKSFPKFPHEVRRWEYPAAVICSGIESEKERVTILDAGSGNTPFPAFLSGLGHEVHACDTGPVGSHPGVRWERASMVDLPYDNRMFDYVFAISSIEHINAGKFAIHGLPGDIGDDIAMRELARVLKPGGILTLTTDIAEQYYPPPGLWKSRSHRIYSPETVYSRLVEPAGLELYDQSNLEFDDTPLRDLPPVGYDYTTCVVTCRKD